MSMEQGHNRVVQSEFRKQAEGFGNPALSLNREDLLEWISGSLQLSPTDRILDTAAGTGILSRHLAPHVREVQAVDLSPAMIAEGERLNKEAGAANITYRQANVEQLQFADGTFDLAISRLAFHHFQHPATVLEEMKRVCRPSGTVCVVDMIASEDAELARRYNHYERLRDPSHTEALSESELVRLFQEAGLTLKTVESRDVPIHVDRWLSLTRTPADVADPILLELQKEIANPAERTGLFPYIVQGELMFRQKWIQLVGIK